MLRDFLQSSMSKLELFVDHCSSSESRPFAYVCQALQDSANLVDSLLFAHLRKEVAKTFFFLLFDLVKESWNIFGPDIHASSLALQSI